MKHFGLKEIDIEHTRYFVGEGAKKFVDRSLIYNGDTDLKLANEAYKVYDEIFAVDCLKGVKPYDGITKLLEALKRMGIKSVVLSNKSQLGVEKNVNGIFGNKVFDLIYGERDGIPKKPDPTSLNMIIEELGLSKSEILYVGDTATDMQTALRAGVTSIGVLWGFRDEDELRENKYITERIAIFFKVLFSIIEKQLYLKIHNEKITISSNVQLLDYLKFSLLNREIEVFKVLFLNTQNELLKEEELFKGTIDRSTVYIRELIKKILNYNAKSVILVHNHPAGSLKPSQSDIILTKKIKEIFEGIEIRLLDHIIISEKGYFSFLEGGIL